MAYFKNGTLFVDVKVYAGPILIKEIPDWRKYLLKIINDLNILMAVNRIALSFLVSFEEWEPPRTNDAKYEKAEKIAFYFQQQTGGSQIDFLKVLFCCLICQIPNRTEDVSILFLGGFLKNKGGMCIKDYKGLFKEALVTAYLNQKRDTVVFAHELLHILGLRHNKNDKSVMYCSATRLFLDETDKKAIRKYIKSKIC